MYDWYSVFYIISYFYMYEKIKEYITVATGEASSKLTNEKKMI